MRLNYHCIETDRATGRTVNAVYVGSWFLGRLIQWPHTDKARFIGLQACGDGTINDHMIEDFANRKAFEASLFQRGR